MYAQSVKSNLHFHSVQLDTELTVCGKSGILVFMMISLLNALLLRKNIHTSTIRVSWVTSSAENET
jgi:hypothetical protein